jgi:hypothetical protein
VSIVEINHFRPSFAALGSLEPNERLLTTGGRSVSKLQAPDRFLKGANHPLLKLIHRIITVVFKLIQAIKRYFLDQKTDLNIARVEVLTEDLLDVLGGTIPDSGTPGYYGALRDLGNVASSLKKTVDRGLENYKQTCLHGEVGLSESDSIRKGAQADRVDLVISRLSGEVLPLLGQKIEELETRVYQKNRETAERIFGQVAKKKPMECGFLESTTLSSKAFLDILKEHYGAPAVKRALKFYGLSNEKVLSGVDAASLIIGMTANLTLEDLKTVFSDCDQLPESELCSRLIEMRQSIAYRLVKPLPSQKYHKQLEHDQMIIRDLNEVGHFSAQTTGNLKVDGLKHYSYSEYLARYITYALFNCNSVKFAEGILIPMYNEENELQLVEAHQLISKNGLHGAIIKPVLPDSPERPFYVTFRGTYCMDSILRDISPSERMQSRLFDGPGRCSYTQNQDSINEAIRKHLQGTSCRTIEFMGHSLGATDAMRAMEYFMQSQIGSQSIPIEEYRLSAFNTPALEPDVADRFFHSVNELKTKTVLRYFDVHHDPIQHLGTMRLGYWRTHATCPENLKISIFKFNRRVDERLAALARNFFKRTRFKWKKALEAHTFACLSSYDSSKADQLNSTFIQDIYSNNPVDQTITYGQELEKSSMLASEEEIGDHMLTLFGRIGRRLKRQVIKVKRLIPSNFFQNKTPRVQSRLAPIKPEITFAKVSRGANGSLTHL